MSEFTFAELLIAIAIVFYGIILVLLWGRLAWATWCDCIRPRIKARRDMAHLRRQRGVRR